MRAELHVEADVGVATVKGEIDASTADRLATLVTRDLPDQAVGVVLDLAEVRYLDSAGVRVLFELAGRMRTSGRRIALAVPETSPLRRLIKITRLEEVAVLCASAAECAEMLRT